MTTAIEAKPRAGHKAIRVDTAGVPRLEGVRCGDCGAVFPEAAMACRSCGGRTALEPFHPASTGKVFSWTVVHRSYPGIAVPFISAIVDLDGGLSLKGTLRDVAPDAVRVGFPVAIAFDDAGGACDKDGAPYIGFHFVPQGDAQ